MFWKYAIRDRLILRCEESGTCRTEVDFGDGLYFFIYFILLLFLLMKVFLLQTSGILAPAILR